MQGYRIIDLNEKTAQLIKDNNLDKNNDRLINEENGELAELLSQTGAKDINELINDNKSDGAMLFLSMGLGSAALGYSLDVSAKKDMKKALYFRKSLLDKLIDAKNQRESKKINNSKYIQYLEDQLARYNFKKSALGKFPKNMFGAFLIPTILFGGLGLMCLLGKPGISMHEYKTKDSSPTQKNTPIAEQNEQKTAEKNTFKETYTQAFKDLGIPEDTELKEYTPQRGEYWISILQAKYNTDSETAQKMANKIKEMIYDDPRAAKQTPVMFLPETWTFEGKTYHYNENAQVATTQDYSDDVQTEMGKMSKDLKYE